MILDSDIKLLLSLGSVQKMPNFNNQGYAELVGLQKMYSLSALTRNPVLHQGRVILTKKSMYNIQLRKKREI